MRKGVKQTPHRVVENLDILPFHTYFYIYLA